MMALSKDQWIDEHTNALDEYAAGNDDRETTVGRLKDLGFDPDEIQEQLADNEDDRRASLDYKPGDYQFTKRPKGQS